MGRLCSMCTTCRRGLVAGAAWQEALLLQVSNTLGSLAGGYAAAGWQHSGHLGLLISWPLCCKPVVILGRNFRKRHVCCCSSKSSCNSWSRCLLPLVRLL